MEAYSQSRFQRKLKENKLDDKVDGVPFSPMTFNYANEVEIQAFLEYLWSVGYKHSVFAVGDVVYVYWDLNTTPA
jgi:hypothetical protein